MLSGNNLGLKAIDCAAAAVLAVAIAFAAFVMATAALAFVLAPIAFILAYAGLGRVDSQRVHRLVEFEVQAFDGDKVIRMFKRSAPRSADPATGDAGQALSDALAELKRSLR